MYRLPKNLWNMAISRGIFCCNFALGLLEGSFGKQKAILFHKLYRVVFWVGAYVFNFFIFAFCVLYGFVGIALVLLQAANYIIGVVYEILLIHRHFYFVIVIGHLTVSIAYFSLCFAVRPRIAACFVR